MPLLMLTTILNENYNACLITNQQTNDGNENTVMVQLVQQILLHIEQFLLSFEITYVVCMHIEHAIILTLLLLELIMQQIAIIPMAKLRKGGRKEGRKEDGSVSL